MSAKRRNPAPSPATMRRLKGEQRLYTKKPPEMMRFKFNPDDMTSVQGWILGPQDTVYEGGVFPIHIKIKKDYPFEAPDVRFGSEMYHPNVYSSGMICVDVLSSQWMETMNLESTATCLQLLLQEPNCDSPANGTASRAYRNDRRAYNEEVRKLVAKFSVAKFNKANPDLAPFKYTPSASEEVLLQKGVKPGKTKSKTKSKFSAPSPDVEAEDWSDADESDL